MASENLILVPWDYTQVAEYALQHAARIAKLTDGTVGLLHVVKKEKEKEEAAVKLNAIADETESKYNVRPEIYVKDGSIFKVISDTSNELDATMVVMGTHGMKGMQKFTGSWALKVIAGTKAPFLVVQDVPANDQFESIVFPINFRIEDKEKLKWANYLAHYFKTKLNVVYQEVTDVDLKHKIVSNLRFAKRYFEERKIDYDIIALRGEDSLAEETIEFAKEIKAGMIMVMTTKHISFQDYVLGADEQVIIANKYKIPVMSVNPREDTRKTGNFGV
jgi:nucleotide-binding universal stress UspA family protein